MTAQIELLPKQPAIPTDEGPWPDHEFFGLDKDQPLEEGDLVLPLTVGDLTLKISGGETRDDTVRYTVGLNGVEYDGFHHPAEGALYLFRRQPTNHPSCTTLGEEDE